MGSYWLAAFFLVPVFAFVHPPFWGRGSVLSRLAAPGLGPGLRVAPAAVKVAVGGGRLGGGARSGWVVEDCRR